MLQIKMVDLKSQYDHIKQRVDEAISEVINSSAFINGPAVKEFSRELAEYNHVNHAVTCGNGTDALQIAMMALDLQPGDEVIVPAFTYVATAEVIALLKLKPIFVDVNPNTFNIDPESVVNNISEKTKAIVVVHLFGQCADMGEILKIASEHGLHTIEDAAQAIGAEYTFEDGRKAKAGTMGTIGTTSFFPSKNLGCYGDGGAIFTSDPEIAEKMRMIANHGQKIKYYHDIVGINSRLDTLQASILRVKLKELDNYCQRRNEAADFYDSHLGDSDQFIIPARAQASTHVFHQYTLRITNGNRDRLKDYLSDLGIPSMIYYPLPLHLQKAYCDHSTGKGSFPVSEKLCGEVLSLPIHTEMSQDQLAFITQSINSFFSKYE